MANSHFDNVQLLPALTCQRNLLRTTAEATPQLMLFEPTLNALALSLSFLLFPFCDPVTSDEKRRWVLNTFYWPAHFFFFFDCGLDFQGPSLVPK